MIGKLAAALLLLAGVPAYGHRLDEYLQGTIVTLEKDRLQAQITLTPGVMVFPLLAAEIDTDSDGVISPAEQRAYAARVLRDVSLSIDGQSLNARVISAQFPPLEQMKQGLGGIQIDFIADLPRGGSNRKLTLENRHQSRISAYLVNCLVPRDPDIHIAAQTRNYSQSRYELEFVRADVRSAGWRLSPLVLLGPFAMVLLSRVLWLHRRAAA